MTDHLSFPQHLAIRGFVEGYHGLPLKPMKSLSPRMVELYADAVYDGHQHRRRESAQLELVR